MARTTAVRTVLVPAGALADGAPPAAREAVAALRSFETARGEPLQVSAAPQGAAPGALASARAGTVVVAEPTTAEGWRDVPLAVARLVDPANARNLAAALAVRLAPDLEDVAVVRAAPDELVARAKAWAPLPARAGVPEGVHVKVPTQVAVRLDAAGKVASVAAAAPAEDALAEASSYAAGLFARGEVALDGRPRRGATHVLETDARGRKLLRRARFAAAL